MSFSNETCGDHTKSSSLKGQRGGCCLLSQSLSFRYVFDELKKLLDQMVQTLDN